MIKIEQEKIAQVFKDKDFVEKILKLQTPEEVQAAFKEKEIKISIEEVQLLGSIINKMIEKKSEKLTEKDLESISGGNIIVEALGGITMLTIGIGIAAMGCGAIAGVSRLVNWSTRNS